MPSALFQYLSAFSVAWGNGWNQFWFRRADPINVALLRIVVGLLALWYVLSFTTDLTDWFATGGMFPGSSIIESGAEATGEPDLGYRWSYLFFIDKPSTLWAVHGLGVVVLALFTVGLFTRVTSVLSLIVVLSYLHRLPMMVGQMEPILAMALFYLCISPAGAMFSLDAKRAAKKKPSVVYKPDAANTSMPANLVMRLLQVHTVALYLFIALTQLGGGIDSPWWNGEASWWLITRSDSRWMDLTFLYRYDLLIDMITHSIVLFELLYVVFIWNRFARPLLIGISIFVWIFIALATGFVGYAIMMIALNIAFLSPESLRAILPTSPVETS